MCVCVYTCRYQSVPSLLLALTDAVQSFLYICIVCLHACVCVHCMYACMYVLYAFYACIVCFVRMCGCIVCMYVYMYVCMHE